MRIFLASFLLWATVQGADWPRFRGPNGAGVDESSTNLPSEVSPSKNVFWKAGVPFGRSSPILAGNRLYLTASEGDLLITLCYNLADGKLLWRREVKSVHKQKVFKANDAASPSAAADGQNVYVFFSDFGLISYSKDGKERWRLGLGPFDNFYGMASSPVVEGDLVLLQCDHNAGSFLLAVDKNSGKQRWKTERAGIGMGWSVPIVTSATKGQKQVIVTATTRIDAYYLSTGERVWWTPVNSEGAMGVPVWNGDSLIAFSSGHDKAWLPSFESTLAQYDKDKDGRVSKQEFSADKDWSEHFGWLDANHDGFIDVAEWKTAEGFGQGGEYGILSIKPGDAKGLLPASAVQWRMKRNLPYVPSPVLYKGVYYMVKDGGITTSVNVATGEILKQGRAADSLGEYYASPVAANGKIYLLNEAGKLTVLKAGGEWEVLGVNDMGEETYATPAIADNRIYLRTRSSLYCFGLR